MSAESAAPTGRDRLAVRAGRALRRQFYVRAIAHGRYNKTRSRRFASEQWRARQPETVHVESDSLRCGALVSKRLAAVVVNIDHRELVLVVVLMCGKMRMRMGSSRRMMKFAVHRAAFVKVLVVVGAIVAEAKDVNAFSRWDIVRWHSVLKPRSRRECEIRMEVQATGSPLRGCQQGLRAQAKEHHSRHPTQDERPLCVSRARHGQSDNSGLGHGDGDGGGGGGLAREGAQRALNSTIRAIRRAGCVTGSEPVDQPGSVSKPPTSAVPCVPSAPR